MKDKVLSGINALKQSLSGLFKGVKLPAPKIPIRLKRQLGALKQILTPLHIVLFSFGLAVSILAFCFFMYSASLLHFSKEKKLAAKEYIVLANMKNAMAVLSSELKHKRFHIRDVKILINELNKRDNAGTIHEKSPCDPAFSAYSFTPQPGSVAIYKYWRDVITVTAYGCNQQPIKRYKFIIKDTANKTSEVLHQEEHVLKSKEDIETMKKSLQESHSHGSNGYEDSHQETHENKKEHKDLHNEHASESNGHEDSHQETHENKKEHKDVHNEHSLESNGEKDSHKETHENVKEHDDTHKKHSAVSHH